MVVIGGNPSEVEVGLTGLLISSRIEFFSGISFGKYGKPACVGASGVKSAFPPD